MDNDKDDDEASDPVEDSLLLWRPPIERPTDALRRSANLEADRIDDDEATVRTVGVGQWAASSLRHTAATMIGLDSGRLDGSREREPLEGQTAHETLRRTCTP